MLIAMASTIYKASKYITSLILDDDILRNQTEVKKGTSLSKSLNKTKF